MACATLKRSLDWESINQRPTKRRRCNPFGAAGSHHHAASQSGAGCSRVLSEPAPSVFADTSACPKMTPEKMAQNIREEITRLHRSKQLTFSTAAVAAAAAASASSSTTCSAARASAASEKMQDSDNSGSEMGPDSPRRADTPSRRQHHHHHHQPAAEKELFSFKQVQLICERMLKEREEYLREQYDNVLTTKLAEQYDAFVKFTYDQIQRRYEAAPSYLS